MRAAPVEALRCGEERAGRNWFVPHPQFEFWIVIFTERLRLRSPEGEGRSVSRPYRVKPEHHSCGRERRRVPIFCGGQQSGVPNRFAENTPDDAESGGHVS